MIVGYDLKPVYGKPTIVCIDCYDDEIHEPINEITEKDLESSSIYCHVCHKRIII